MKATLGIDVGGTTVRVAAVRRDGTIVASAAAPTPEGGEPQALCETLRGLLASVSGAVELDEHAAGVAIPGIRDRATGRMVRALNLPRLEGLHLADLFESALARPVRIDSDVNAAGWAQWHALCVERPRRFIYVSLGTGVGGCVILDGALVRHANDGAGHFGYLVVDADADAPVDVAGVRGSLSAFASGPALEALRRRLGVDGARRAAARAIAVACSIVAHVFLPDAIVLGGGVVDHDPQLATLAQDGFAPRRSVILPEGLRLRRGPLAADAAGVVGAALLV